MVRIFWPNFYSDWIFYWSLKEKSIGDNDPVKCFAFIACFPVEEHQRCRDFVICQGYTFKMLSDMFISNNKGMIPRWSHEKTWRDCLPKSRSYKDIMYWYGEWTRLAAKVGHLTDVHLIEQFDQIMLKNCSSYMRKILEQEVRGEQYTLTERWTYISEKLKMTAYVKQIEDVHVAPPSYNSSYRTKSHVASQKD